ncbi:coxsackievirus and adenovirus receptor-like [Lethenteron reissneri]|uniref:coxsackievirus and adenovirus receptor-like n=1 Tax=Lethenteron reissneri TaxID=7753 RepID=UPI002AB68660|nr:coxsackievirus and adenovirus receptor-like [Lethenteron reissneri]
MEVATGAVSWVEKAEGETVLLGCTWTVDPAPTEHLDVEWFMQMPTTNIHLATYVRGVEHVYPEYASRMRFARNVTQRDASLKIVGVQTRDYGFYTCKVKFGAFIQQVSVKLIVLVKPTQPVCVVNGSAQQGKELSLQCQSAEGTSPISYEWSKGGAEEPLPSVLRGTLRIRDVSVSHSGLYRCNASNRVGWRSCVVLLSVVTPSSDAGLVPGALMGVLLVVAATGFLLWYRLLKRKPGRHHDRRNDVWMDDCLPASTSLPPATHDPPSTRTSIGSAATPSDGLLAALRRPAPGGPTGPGGPRGAPPGRPPYERADGRVME